MKGSGDTPHQLAGEIRVTLADGADYYLAPRREIIVGDTAINLAAAGYFAAVGLAVPAGQVWLLYNITTCVDTATAAATAVKFWGGYTKNSGLSSDVQLTEPISLGAADFSSAYRAFERPGIFLPGDSFGVRCGTITGVPAVKGRVKLDIARITL